MRDCAEQEIRKLIERVAGARCEPINKVEEESLRSILGEVAEISSRPATTDVDH